MQGKEKARKQHYIDNSRFYEEMTKYSRALKESRANGTEPPVISDYIGKCFLELCQRLARRPNFRGYSYAPEMVNDAVENLITATQSFDPDKSKNAFGYFTRIAWYAFVRRIEKEKRQQYVKYKSLLNSYSETDFENEPGSSRVNSRSHGLSSEPIFETANRIVSEWETKHLTGKRKV